MELDCKYVVMDYITATGIRIDTIFVFPNWVTHREMAKQLGGKILSAGFVSSNNTCYGESTSLGIGSRKEDTYLYHMMRNIERK